MAIIIEREKIKLTQLQEKMVKSGWGAEAIDDSDVEKITYLSDGLKVKGYVATPKDKTKKYPCIIWCRGGFGNAGAIDHFNAAGIFGQLAAWGYTVLSTQYRGNDGGEGQDDFGGDDVNDILNLIKVADEVDVADTNIWGIEGWSRGGMMTYITLTKTNIFKAAVVTGGIANLRCNTEESRFMKRLYANKMGEFGTEDFALNCGQRSIVGFADQLPKTTPLLILHGTADERVLPHDSIDLSYKLLDNDIKFRLVMLEDGDHFLKNHRKEVDRNRKEWYSKYLL